ncbi:LOW QUALITY PROTEIN: zinc finger CCCH domain-containing protein 18-like [Mantella aurantiaca]
MSCRFIHPGMNDKGNYSLISKPDPFSANGTPSGGAQLPQTPWGAPVTEELLPPPILEPPTESAWERGLRHAKEVLKKATIRKEQEPDFEEKRLTVTIGEDEREFDKENDYFRDWNYRITREVRETGEVEFRETITQGDPYPDPYYDLEMDRYWRGGQYENFRVQYTESEPYRYRERERERDRDRQRDRDRDRDRERRQREREREREREKDRQKRKDEWERDRSKRDEKERQKEKEKEKDKKLRSPLLPKSVIFFSSIHRANQKYYILATHIT